MAEESQAFKFMLRPLQMKDGDRSEHASSVDDPSVQPPINPNPTLHEPHKIERSIYDLEAFPVYVMLRIFQAVFSQFDRFNWVEEFKESDIYIVDKYPEGLDEEELKPAIVTDRGNISLARINGRTRNKRVDQHLNVVEFSDMVQCQMTIHCASKVGVETGQIASAVMGILVQLEDDLKRWGIHALLDPSIGSEQPFDSGSEYELMETPVSVTIQYGWGWARKYDGPIIRQAETTLVDLSEITIAVSQTGS